MAISGIRIASIATLFLLAASKMLALSVEPPEFSGLVAASAQIVRGHVVSVESRQIDTADGKVIRTFVRVTVDEAIKGDTKQRIVEFSQLGGQVDDVRLEVPGMPQFKVGEDGFFFLHSKRTAVSGLVRVGHGRYPILEDTATGRRYVARENRVPLTDSSEVSLPLNAIPPAAARASIPRALSPEAFAQEIKAEVARAPAQQRAR